MRPIVEVTMACRNEGCPGRVHVHAPRRRGPLVGVCDTCDEIALVDLTGEAPTSRRSGAPLLVRAAS